jgi:hypothetical protein
MAHGHSHGGSSKSKTKINNKKDEDSVEIGDSEHLCADERVGNEDNHGHSHDTPSLTLDSSRITNGGDTNSKRKTKKGSKKKSTKKN